MPPHTRVGQGMEKLLEEFYSKKRIAKMPRTARSCAQLGQPCATSIEVINNTVPGRQGFILPGKSGGKRKENVPFRALSALTGTSPFSFPSTQC